MNRRTISREFQTLDRRTVFGGIVTYSFVVLLMNLSSPVIGAPQNNNNAAGGGSILTMAADDLIQPSASWLLERSKQSGSWGVDTPRALLALLRVSADRSATTTTSTVNWDANSLQGLILRQEFDIQLLLFLLRNHGSTPQEEQTNTLEPSRSLFSLTLTAMCRNPRDFYGQDLLAPIMALEEDHDGVLLQPFTFAFNAMAVCAGGGHLKRRHVVKLLESINQSPVQTHNIDLLAMVVLATSCLYQSSPKYRHLQDFLEQPLKMIAAQQQPDGSFDHNVATTALAIQALKIPGQLLEEQLSLTKPISLPAWRPDLTVDWLRSQQKADGSFGDLFITSEVLLALATQPGYGFLYSQCSNLNNQSGQLSTTTTEAPPTSPTAIPSAGSLGGDPAKKVHFTYVVWIGQNRSEVYAIQLTVPANSSFYEAMKIAAEADPRFEFSASVWPNGHYIHTIGGHRDQYIGFHFWLLFCMPMMPDPANPPSVVAPHFVAVGGVDDMFPKNGDYYLFWYKDV
uniref:Uncharacterized protein n=1 Tax=Daphnia galeata TaxID=27404 RepID=A0A8J2RSH8_9CRUS|nr:unnamed protein product [Daphnia galeata]